MLDRSFGLQTARIGQALLRMSVIVILAYALNACSAGDAGPTQPPAEPTSTATAPAQTQAPTIPPAATQTAVATETPASAASSSAQAFTETPTAVPGVEPTLTPAGWQVYFTNPLRLSTNDEMLFDAQIPAADYQGSIAQRLIRYIDDAKSSIHIASFETDLDDVAHALIRAKTRHVDVRWITDDQFGTQADGKPGHGQFKLLKDAGIPVIDDGRSALMHDKFWIFDGRTVWTGSTNVTVSGMFEQNNNAIIVESPELAAIYERQFADMWSGHFNAKSPSTVDQQSLTIDGTAVQVLFSPEDKAMNHLLPYVQAARTSIDFLAFSYTQERLGAAMIERKNAGVDVRGVFETTGSTGASSQMPPLYCAHAPVRQDGNPAFMHDKVIIIDDHVVITGSLNFSDNADLQNDENVIILDNAQLAELYTQEFQRVWAAGNDPDPAKMKCP